MTVGAFSYGSLVVVAVLVNLVQLGSFASSMRRRMALSGACVVTKLAMGIYDLTLDFEDADGRWSGSGIVLVFTALSILVFSVALLLELTQKLVQRHLSSRRQISDLEE